MTLNVTLLTPGYIIQVSDRRMTALPAGKWIDDSANKGVVLQTADGIFAITFAGVGMYRGQRTDLWLAQMLAQEGGPEIPIEDVLSVIAEKATAWFATFHDAKDKRHVFVVSGWRTFGAEPKPAIWTVGNYAGERNQALETAQDWFDVQGHPTSRKSESVYAFGLHQAIDRSSKRRFQASLRKRKDAESAEAALVRLVRAAAANPTWSWGINGNVLAVALSPVGQAVATFHPEGIARLNYAPVFVWHDRGFNHAAGDADIVPTSEFGYRFGRVMLVGPVGGVGPEGGTIPDVERIGFRAFFTPAKFSGQAVEAGDVHELVGIFPLTERARRLMAKRDDATQQEQPARRENAKQTPGQR